MRPMGLGLTIMAFILVLGVHPVENRGRIYQPTVGGEKGGDIACPLLDAAPSCLWYPVVLFRPQTPSVERPVKPQAPPRTLSVTATAYAVGDGSGWTTYTGTKVRQGVLAVSHDLRHLMGQRVRIGGLGEFRVEDLMHRRWTMRVDIWHESLSVARRFGVRTMKMEVIDE